MSTLPDTLASIQPVDRSLESDIQAHLNDLTKPPGSLGKLETIAMRYGLITGTVKPIIGDKKIFCFAGDHGVADEGVSAYPKEVTPQMVMNMLAGGAAINVLARHVGAEIVVIDIGVNDPLDGAESLVRRKVRSGTGNIAVGPAMTVKEVTEAVTVGIDLAKSAVDEGIRLIGTGDMGIANTTPSTALFAAYLNMPVESITGRGTGVDDATLQNKIRVIKKALDVNKDKLTDPLNILAALGGLEMAGICGLVLGAASCRTPVVVDGFISSAGAVAACEMNEFVHDYLFFSHLSEETGHRAIMDKIGAIPILDLDLRLGEGTGSALAMSLIEASVKMYNEMATFSSAGVSEK